MHGCQDASRHVIRLVTVDQPTLPRLSRSHTDDERLATQLEVWEESQLEDQTHLEMPGGTDINSHEDMFNAVFGKVVCAVHAWCALMSIRLL